jgi:hypothetical protein
MNHPSRSNLLSIQNDDQAVGKRDDKSDAVAVHVFLIYRLYRRPTSFSRRQLWIV